MTKLFRQRGWTFGRQATRSSEHGNSIVELALVLPVIIGLLLGALDFGRVFYSAMAVTHAVTVGASYGAQSDTNSQNTAGIQSAAAAAATDISGFSATAVQ